MSDTHYTFSFSLFGKRFYFTPNFTGTVISAVLVFVILGIMQLRQANTNNRLIGIINHRIILAPLSITSLSNSKDYEYYPIQVRGTFDNQHQFLIDNQTYHGQKGYMVIAPFKANDGTATILVNRGWIAAEGKSIPTLSALNPVHRTVTITGLLIDEKHHWNNQKAFDETNVTWPLLSTHVDIDKYSKLLKHPLEPYIILLNPDNHYGFTRDWVSYAENLDPQKHRTAAARWFSLALLVLLLYFFANLQRS